MVEVAVNCRHCGSALAPRAGVCAACGRGQTNWAGCFLGGLAIIGGAFILLIIVAQLDPPADSAARAADANLRGDAEWRLQQAARNPDKLVTRDVHVGTGLYAGQRVVCGSVNGENGFGGMSGFQRFVMVGGKVPLIEPLGADRGVFEQAWREGGC